MTRTRSKLSAATRQPVPPEMNPGDDAAEDTPGTGEDVCPVCRGRGVIGNQPCDNCGGTGKVTEGIGGG
jgi:RecJ-like exonuclease